MDCWAQEKSRFSWQGVYQLAEDAAATSTSKSVNLSPSECATVRVAVIKATRLPEDSDTRKPVSPYVKVRPNPPQQHCAGEVPGRTPTTATIMPSCPMRDSP